MSVGPLTAFSDSKSRPPMFISLPFESFELDPDPLHIARKSPVWPARMWPPVSLPLHRHNLGLSTTLQDGVDRSRHPGLKHAGPGTGPGGTAVDRANKRADARCGKGPSIEVTNRIVSGKDEHPVVDPKFMCVPAVMGVLLTYMLTLSPRRL